MPIQLWIDWGPPKPDAVSSDGSVGWYVARERRRRVATSNIKSPRNTFQGRLRVGERTMRIGLIIGLLLLIGCSRTCRERAEEANRESQSSFYYPGAG
jgi:hypothetical protein